MQPMQPAPQSANGIQYGPQEFEFYQQLFAIASPDGRDALDPNVAANFLAASQLSQEVLHQIWHFATSLQSYTQQYLTTEGFFIACRLVAWAQNGGLPMDMVHAHQPPPLLPEFPGLQQPPSSMGSPPQSMGGSEVSDMQPVIRLQQAAPSPRGRSPSPRRSFTAERWAPSRREKRKYASLFKRTDWDQDGFIQGPEAWQLLERSRLDPQTLQQIFELADGRSRDGKLDFREFVCMVHLVTCLLRGARLNPQGLEPQLQQALMQLEPLELLASEREASRSRSASPIPPVATEEVPQTQAFSEVPDFQSAWNPGGGAPDGAFPSDFPQDFGDLGTQNFGDFQDGQDGQDLGQGFGGDWPDSGEGEREKSKKDKKEKKKKDKKDKDKEQDKGMDAMDAMDAMNAFGAPTDFGLGSFQPDPLAAGDSWGMEAPQFDDPFRTAEFEDVAGFPENEKVRHLRSVVATDRALAHELRREVDHLDKNLRQLQETDVKLEQLLSKDAQEVQMLHAHKQALERDLEDEKQRLAQLREARNSANHESLALRRDRKHLIAELRFLRHMAEEEEGLILVLQNSNQYLEASRGTLEASSAALAKISAELQNQISTEKDQLQLDSQRCAELRTQLVQLQRTEPAASKAGPAAPVALVAVPLGPRASPVVMGHREGV
ncbi:unnamed protein product [Cladocopium goreaui]|uniref:Epidermal growth factor receptor substrate 15 n=1 Tax=Cladocopium goreaui TaxID=2562237 RepID=A0A9P1FWQ8_9DINO|nr:unnamed protein product [Cladocopium goreaui]